MSEAATNPTYEQMARGRTLVGSDGHWHCEQPLNYRINRRLRAEKTIIHKDDILDFVRRECTEEQLQRLKEDGFVDFGLDFRKREGLEKIGRVRCNVRNADLGASLNMKVRFHASRVFRLDEFDLRSTYLERDIVRLRRGAVMFYGPPGMAKSSLRSSFLQAMLDDLGVIVTSFEEPIELLLQPGRGAVEQIEIPTDIRSLDLGLAALKRSDTNVVSVQEARRPEDKEAFVEAARSMFSMTTGHAKDSVLALEDFIETVPASSRDGVRTGLANTLECIVVMRQFPRKNRLSDSELEKLRVDERQNVVHAYEIMIATDGVRNIIRNGDYSRIRNQIAGSDRMAGSRPLEADLADLVVAGDIEEADARAEACSQSFFDSELKRAKEAAA